MAQSCGSDIGIFPLNHYVSETSYPPSFWIKDWWWQHLGGGAKYRRRRDKLWRGVKVKEEGLINKLAKGKLGESGVMWPFLTASHHHKALAEQLLTLLCAPRLSYIWNSIISMFHSHAHEASALSNTLAYYALYTNPTSPEIHLVKATSHRCWSEGQSCCL